MCQVKQLWRAALVSCAVQMAGTAHGSPVFTSFDPSGSVYTEPLGINDSGAISGYYEDSAGVFHGFVRTPSGAITRFDPPSSVGTHAYGINKAGSIVGQFDDSQGGHCFIRNSADAFTVFDPQPLGQQCYALAINARGRVAGYVYESRRAAYGFVQMKSGKIKDIAGGTGYTVAAAINDSGATTGVFGNEVESPGFLRAADGTIATFDAPNDTNGTFPQNINASGWITGFYTASSTADHAFVRAPDGTITDFDPPGAGATEALGVNAKGAITGFYFGNGTYHGFVRAPDGTINSFDAPGAADGTLPEAINEAGAITGWYRDGQNGAHGFLRSP